MGTTTNQQFEPVTHVIFDLDGTLIDSEKFLFRAVSDILEKYDKTYDWEIRSKTLGLFITKSAPMIIEHCQLPVTDKEFIRMVLVRFKSYISGEIEMSTNSSSSSSSTSSSEKIQLLPGVQRLLDHLLKHNIPMAVCTGSMKETFDHKIIPFGDLFTSSRYFKHVVLGAADPEISQNKPSPEPYLVCIQRFTRNSPESEQIKPGSVLAFEDSPTGLTSALDAGCQCVLIPDPKLDCSRLKKQPTLILESMEHFRPELFGLPPF